MSAITMNDCRQRMKALAKAHGDSELISLLRRFTEEAERAAGKTPRYPDFWEAVASCVSPVGLTDPDEVAARLREFRPDWPYRALSLFVPYATLCAVGSAENKTEPGDVIAYLKKIRCWEPDALFKRLSEAERILAGSESFAGCDEVTQNVCRNHVIDCAARFRISEAEAAAILIKGEPTKPQRPSAASRLYFPVLAALAVLLSAGSFFVCRPVGVWLFLLLPLTETAKQLCDFLFSFFVRPRPIPRKKLTELPDNARTLVVITALLTGREDDLFLVDKLQNACFANRGKNACFGLLCDLKEADHARIPSDVPTIRAVKEKLDRINREYGLSLFLFVRERRFAPTESKYMGWERKRGAVIELTRLLRGRETSIRILCGKALPTDVRYVVTLDSDTRLHTGSLCDLVGAMLHPANRPVIKNGAVVSGHAILQPRMEPSLTSAEKTPFSVLSAGNGGSDIYASASYETYQSLFDEGIFCGKGIFDLAVFSELIDGAFPDGAVLSHDLLEGSRLRAGALTDLPLNDDIPGSPLSALDRSHRWIRGDVQALAFAGSHIADGAGRRLRNPISPLSRFKLIDNVRRALVPIFSAAALLLCLFAPERTRLPILLFALSYCITPFLLTVLRVTRGVGRRFFSYVMPGYLHAVSSFLYSVSSLLQTALTSADAVLRAGWRTLFSRQRTLEWKTAAEAERGIRGLPLYFYRMLPSCLIGLSVLIFSSSVLLKAIGASWFIFPLIACRIGKPFRSAPRIKPEQKAAIAAYASDIWRFFADHVTEADAFLPPDNVQLSPAETTARRTSPTNIGLYLLSCLSAEAFGFLRRGELYSRLTATVKTVESLPKWRGHLYNWYDTGTLTPLGKPYVSTVDSGNFVTALVALRAGLKRLGGDSRRVADLCDRIGKLIDEADFSALYDTRKKLFVIGRNTAEDRPDEGCYDLFMSEARTTSYFAIASGQVPREHWKHLGRPLTVRDGYLGVLSWTGTMFEFLMPALLLPTRFGSLSHEAIAFAVREQRAAASHGLWGRSESGYFRFDSELNYQYKAFGVPSLGLKNGLEKDDVIAPYASFLCLKNCPAAALNNLAALKKHGMYGPYGFYEALDLTPSRVGRGRAVIRSYMSHHAGMSLIACANACFRDRIVTDFLSDPRMASAVDLLEEKIPVDSRPGRSKIRSSSPAPRAPRPFREVPAKTAPLSAPDFPLCAGLSENGLTAVACGPLLRLSDSGREISVDPFVFGWLRRPRFLIKAEDKTYDLLAGRRNRGAAPRRLIWQTDAPDLTAELSLSILGSCRAFVFSLEAEGRFRLITPLFVMEPSLDSSREREAHPAYSDLLITVSYLEEENALLYVRRSRNGRNGDRFLAVSLEAHGKPAFETSRDMLGLLYRDAETESLLDKPFSCRTGAPIHPLCAVKKDSETKGRYVGNLLLCPGDSRDRALSSLREARAFLKRSKHTNGAKAAADSYRKTVSDRLAVCPGGRESLRVTELLLTVLHRPLRTEPPDERFEIGDLWRRGISGDLPIVTLILGEVPREESAIRRHLCDFLSAHKYLTLCGFRFDLVILYPDEGGYRDPYRDAILESAEQCADAFLWEHSGGLFPIGLNAEERREQALFSAVSVLSAALDRDFVLETVISACQPVVPPEPLRQKPEGILRRPDMGGDPAVFGGVFRPGGFEVNKGTQHAPWSFVYALPHFGTLVTQNSLGYTWIGNSHERRISSYRPDPLLDLDGERLILTTDAGRFDLCACADVVTFGRGGAVWRGTVDGKSYQVTVSVDPKMPVKVVSVVLPVGIEPEQLAYTVRPVLGEREASSRPILKKAFPDGVTGWIPVVSGPDGRDVGFLIRRDFPGMTGFLLGACPEGGNATLRAVSDRYRDPKAFTACSEAYAARIASFLPSLSLSLPDPYLAEMISYYLPYQALVCRLFGRTGFYQSGGAYGFRDQLQDCLCLMRSAPFLCRVHLFRAASHQYEEGDVMHWWHTVRGKTHGIRTRYADDRLWLPFVAGIYRELTGDASIWGVTLPYFASDPLRDGETERYETPVRSRYRESFYHHCVRAIEHSLVFGPHGLPLMAGGDWNDGMNLVGQNGGESVWLGEFLILVLERFAPIAASQGDLSGAAKYRQTAAALRRACTAAFSEDHFLRAFWGDGAPLGEGGSVDLLPQAFAAFSGLPDAGVASALGTASNALYDKEARLVRLLTPPFSAEDRRNPGYIAAYPPGVRENGGQYTHAAVWFAMALAESGKAGEAAALLRDLLPASLTADREGADRYRGEPYFIAGDLIAEGPDTGRCGWSLYTGAAGWYWLAVTETLMGFSFRSDRFSVTPLLSDSFPRYTVRFVRNETEYTVAARLGEENQWRLDGKQTKNLFYFDKKSHLLEITVEKSSEV